MAIFRCSDVIVQVRTILDRDGTDNGVTDAQIMPILSSKLHLLRLRIGEVAPDLFTSTVAFEITTGNDWDLTEEPGPSGIDYVGKILKIEKLVGDVYYPLPVAPHLSAQSGLPGYRRFGTTNVYFYPEDDAIGEYRCTFITKHPTENISSTSEQFSLPEGGLNILALEVAAVLRLRFEESPAAELAMAKEAWAAFVETLADQYKATPQQIAEVY